MQLCLHPTSNKQTQNRLTIPKKHCKEIITTSQKIPKTPLFQTKPTTCTDDGRVTGLLNPWSSPTSTANSRNSSQESPLSSWSRPETWSAPGGSEQKNGRFLGFTCIYRGGYKIQLVGGVEYHKYVGCCCWWWWWIWIKWVGSSLNLHLPTCRHPFFFMPCARINGSTCEGKLSSKFRSNTWTNIPNHPNTTPNSSSVENAHCVTIHPTLYIAFKKKLLQTTKKQSQLWEKNNSYQQI